MPFILQGCMSLGIYHPHHQYDWLFEPPQKIRAEVNVNGTFEMQEIALWRHNPSWRGEVFLTLGELILKSQTFFRGTVALGRAPTYLNLSHCFCLVFSCWFQFSRSHGDVTLQCTCMQDLSPAYRDDDHSRLPPTLLLCFCPIFV